MKIQVIGFGSIGRNLLRLIAEKNWLIKKRLGENFEVVSVSDTTGTVMTEGIPLTRVIEAKQGEGLRTIDSFERMSALDAISDIDSDIVVEVTNSTKSGRPGMDHIIGAFESGKDVVTANKGVLITEDNLFNIAREMKRSLRYEATVCGGIPVFNLMEYSIGLANIYGVGGLFNATSTFIISLMESGKSRDYASKEASRIGLAERDDNDDLLGIDSARKGLILHRRIFGSSLGLKDVKIEIEKEDIAPGHRQVAQVSQEGVKVEYRKIENDDPFRGRKGASMVIRFETDIFDNLTLFTDHDGPLESAATVLNDILLSGKGRK